MSQSTAPTERYVIQRRRDIDVRPDFYVIVDTTTGQPASIMAQHHDTLIGTRDLLNRRQEEAERLDLSAFLDARAAEPMPEELGEADYA